MSADTAHIAFCMCGCRWIKNLNQGTDGAEVDDLLQLSYLQRLARQKVAEMEVSWPSLALSMFG